LKLDWRRYSSTQRWIEI